MSQSNQSSTLRSGATSFSKAKTSVTAVSAASTKPSRNITLADLDDSVSGFDLIDAEINETQERLAALMSPVKGKKRLTSDVSGHISRFVPSNAEIRQLSK